MKNAKPKRKASFFLTVVILIFVACSAVAVIRVRAEITVRERELASILEQCEDKRIENKETERLFRLEDDDEYFQRIARERLGFVYPDERVFIDVSGS